MSVGTECLVQRYIPLDARLDGKRLALYLRCYKKLELVSTTSNLVTKHYILFIMQHQTIKALRCVYIVIRNYILRASYRSVPSTITSIWLYSVTITMLVSSLVLSRLDYCNALLADSPQVLLDKIQGVINCSGRLIFKGPKSAHITLILYDLHWIAISSRIQ